MECAGFHGHHRKLRPAHLDLSVLTVSRAGNVYGPRLSARERSDGEYAGVEMAILAGSISTDHRMQTAWARR